MPETAAGRRRLEFWPLAAAILGALAALALGQWQLGRAAEKREVRARLEAHAGDPPIRVPASALRVADVEWRRVEAHGVFDPERAVYLDNRIRRGRPGYEVVMPLKLAGGELHVLVNRGWIARPPERTHVPSVPTPAGPVTVTGTAVVPGKRILELSNEVIEGPIWQNLTIARYREAVPVDIQPFVIRQDSALDDGLSRDWPAPDYGIDKHYGYAFQWFALAATILVFYGLSRRRRRHKP